MWRVAESSWTDNDGHLALSHRADFGRSMKGEKDIKHLMVASTQTGWAPDKSGHRRIVRVLHSLSLCATACHTTQSALPLGEEERRRDERKERRTHLAVVKLHEGEPEGEH
ncbi:hypothetical protein EYF80_037049 [Liparis tanakae]|uniref:Uncharacterized protein n=1 Tax=Liparis tanakae TaxID=230148 RepID=A0A4Z2GHV1_9TELE|nr:hypothetical protein EYF80_037049 [Liparis tanakae]